MQISHGPFFCREGIAGSLVLALLAGTWVRGEAFLDTIVMKGGGTFPEKVAVIKETYREVTYYNERLPKQSQPYDRMQEIKHGDEPREYQGGMIKMSKQRYEDAIQDLQKASAEAESGKVREWIHQYTKFYIARCYQMVDRYKEGVEAYQLLLSKHPETIFLPQAHEALGQCYQGLGGESNFQEALKAFRKLPEFGPEWALRSQRGEAQVLEARKNFDAAAEKYREIIKQASADKQFQNVVNLAYDGLGRSLLKAEKIRDAVQTFNDLKGVAEKVKGVRGVPETAYGEGMAIACNGLGDCMFKLGRFEDAALQYLRVTILYPEEAENQTARAVFQAARCFEQLSRQAAIPKDKQKLWTDRYRELLSEVISKYPDSPSGKEAKGMLK
ncbi:MAG: tetratricopeptide repeat protein [Planctomycetes bacterium]|nr:tetratricopeptide repeat protein [Planctomycetota bacterium]